MTDPIRITEQTTFAQLAEQLSLYGDPFVTLGIGPLGSSFTRYAMIHSAKIGSFQGCGHTVAKALDEAFIALRLALLPQPLKEALSEFVNGPIESEHDQYDRATGDLGRPIDGLCHGCAHARAEHPNDTGCQLWHEAP
jgi:hypothetical protein